MVSAGMIATWPSHTRGGSSDAMVDRIAALLSSPHPRALRDYGSSQPLEGQASQRHALPSRTHGCPSRSNCGMFPAP